MKYAILIYIDEKAPTGTPAEREAIHGEYMALSEAAGKAGILVGGEPLEDSDTATTVRVRDGKRTTTDGPFAETKEVLGGFFLLDVPSIDEALDFAAKLPAARYGSVEVRAIADM